MYLDHFGLSEAPYRITPHTDFFFEGANRGPTLEALLYAITRDEGIVKVTGEVGSGKTMLCRVLMERLPHNVETIYLANPSLGRDEIMLAILDDLKVASDGQRSSLLLRALQDRLIELYAAGRQVVVLIDEAHAMPVETLEEIRLLSNLESKRHKLLQIVLFGQQELDEVLATPQMRQLKERIVHSFRLEPLVRSDIGTYLMFRLRQAGYKGPDIFTPGAVKLMAEASEGLTRRINILADKALLAAFSDGGHQILPRHVNAAIADSEFSRIRARRPRGFSTATLAVAAVALIATGAAAALLAVYLAVMRGPVTAQTPLPGTAPAVATRDASGPAPANPVGAATAGGVAANEAAPPSASNPAQANPPQPPAAVTPPANAALNVQPGRAESPSTMQAKANVAAAAPVAAEDKVAVRPGAPPTLAGRLQATEAWLGRSPENTFTLQLLVADGTRAREVDAWIGKLSGRIDPDRLFVYSSVIRGSERFSVLYGSFPDRQSATAAIAELPKNLREGKPMVRSVGGILADRRRETP